MGHFNVSCIAHEILNKLELLKQKLEMMRYDENENEYEYANEMRNDLRNMLESPLFRILNGREISGCNRSNWVSDISPSFSPDMTTVLPCDGTNGSASLPSLIDLRFT
jgi:hypothetical protein